MDTQKCRNEHRDCIDDCADPIDDDFGSFKFQFNGKLIIKTRYKRLL
jgi:hypothetical protein